MGILDSIIKKAKDMELEILLGGTSLYVHPTNAFDEMWIGSKLSNAKTQTEILYLTRVATLAIATEYLGTNDGEKVLIADDLNIPLTENERDSDGKIKPFSEWSRQVREKCAEELFNKLMDYPSKYIIESYSNYDSILEDMRFEMLEDRLREVAEQQAKQEEEEKKKVEEKEKEEEPVQPQPQKPVEQTQTVTVQHNKPPLKGLGQKVM